MKRISIRGVNIIFAPIIICLLLGFLMLHSIAPQVFPQYYVYIVLSIVIFFVFLRTDFDTLSAFSNFFYVGSIALLILPIIIGQVTRGTIRWIPIGGFNLQPAEIVRPFLILFFANYFTTRSITLKRFIISVPLMGLPLVLIFLQPSLGVTLLTSAGFAGVIFSLNIPRKYYLWAVIAFIVASPIFWLLLAPYQKARVNALLSPGTDPSGQGYNSIQSVIAVGSGMFSGRGLGNGIQTQLSFLPEKHTDFMFAAISEELGFFGAAIVLASLVAILYGLTKILEKSSSSVKRAYVAGVFMTFFMQVFVHMGMNMGMLPITGVPLPLVSYGGSSLLSTAVLLALALQGDSISGKIQSI